MSKKRLPNWIWPFLDEFVVRVVELGDVVHLTVHGIKHIHKMPKVVESLVEWKRLSKGDFNKADEDAAKEEIREAKRLGNLAARESKRGFPLVYGQATVTLWAMLEDLIRTFVATWLSRKPTALRIDEIQKLKISLGDFNALTRQERHEYIVAGLEQNLILMGKKGAGRFEPLLKLIGLGGSIDSKTRRDLVELSSFRHALAHGRRRVDRKLARECSWMRLRVGAPLSVSDEQVGRFLSAAVSYTITLLARLNEKYGVETKHGRTPTSKTLAEDP